MVAHTRLSECWVWSYNSKKQTICCTFPNILPDGSAIIKVVKILKSQKVAYLLNGRVIPPIGLVSGFKSIEEISLLITEFDRKTSCVGIDSGLQEVKVSARFAGIESTRVKVPARLSGVIADGIFRSKNCLTLVEKTKACIKCRQLAYYLSQRLKKAQKPIELKNRNKKYPLSSDTRKRKLDGCRRKIRTMESKFKVWISPLTYLILTSDSCSEV